MIELSKFTRILQKGTLVLLATLATIYSLSTFIKELIPLKSFVLLGGIIASAFGAVIAYIIIVSINRIRLKKTVFVSYTHQDMKFVNQLLDQLSDLNIRFLVDRVELNVGDDIQSRVSGMIESADSIIYVVSKSSSTSAWSQKELDRAISRKKKILPVVIDKDAMPEALSGLYYADFTQESDVGFAQLRKTLQRK